MTTIASHGSAKIYEFPLRGRFAIGRLDNAAQATGFALPRVAKVAFGGAWYHDEAIQEELANKD